MNVERQRAAERRLLNEFTTYDQHVDVVSAFEWIFTDPGVKSMPETVFHFERFPKIQDKGVILTPDFTVLFKDGTAIVAEIAQLALAEGSVDGLCDQIDKYANLTDVPHGLGLAIPPFVTRVDVLHFVPMATGNSAYRRIIVDRYLNEDHPYKPVRPPCIVQYARENSGYTYQRIQAQHNGTLPPLERSTHIQTYLDSDFRPIPKGWVPVKVRRPFINDPVPSLYLATQLWTRVWPSQHGTSTDDISVDPTTTAKYLRDRYGTVRSIDVRRALELLDQVGLAAALPDGSWLVSRSRITKQGEKDVHRIIAGRLIGNPRRVVPRTLRPDSPPAQPTLFDS